LSNIHAMMDKVR